MGQKNREPQPDGPDCYEVRHYGNEEGYLELELSLKVKTKRDKTGYRTEDLRVQKAENRITMKAPIKVLYGMDAKSMLERAVKELIAQFPDDLKDMPQGEEFAERLTSLATGTSATEP